MGRLLLKSTCLVCTAINRLDEMVDVKIMCFQNAQVSFPMVHTNGSYTSYFPVHPSELSPVTCFQHTNEVWSKAIKALNRVWWDFSMN